MKKITLLFTAALLLIGAMSVYAQPSTSAPTPPARSDAKVISIFCDAYANLSGTDFNPFWGQTTVVSTVQVGTDNVLKYANLNYQGTQLSGNVNAAPMNKLHIDIWSADATNFQITPISPGPKEFLLTLSPIVLGQWNSFDVDLTSFTGVAFSEIFQFKVVGNGTVYIDNLYFYDSSATVDTEAPAAFTAKAGAVASDGIELLLHATDNSGSVNYTVSYGEGPTVVNAGGISGVEKSLLISGLTPSTSYTFSVSVKDATGNEASNSPITVQSSTSSALPAAPVPSFPAHGVVSIYCDSYTNLTGINFYPGWGQSTTVSELQLDGNNTMKYTNFNYQGIELSNHAVATNMDKLHIDIYPVTETNVRITPISPGPKEFPKSVGTLIAGQWNSIDINLSDFTGVSMSDVFQFKFDGGTGKAFYWDNLYFYNSKVTGLTLPDTESKCYFDVNGVLQLSMHETVDRLTVYNSFGQCVKTVNGIGSQITDLNFLPNGPYFVVVESENKNQVFKVLKL